MKVHLFLIEIFLAALVSGLFGFFIGTAIPDPEWLSLSLAAIVGGTLGWSAVHFDPLGAFKQ